MPALLAIPVLILLGGWCRERAIERREQEHLRQRYQVAPESYGAGKPAGWTVYGPGWYAVYNADGKLLYQMNANEGGGR
jgi:hypothetical protein